jgi:RNA polymerase sigma factor (sigma-70 family)
VSWESIRRRRPTTQIEDDSAGLETPRVAERLDLEHALQRLPDTFRAVVVLHDVEGFGHDEIAALLGIATGTSRSHLSRARQQLRHMLASYERITK